MTHSLVGFGAARLLARDGPQTRQLAIAGVLGSLLLDGDAWLYFLGPNHYGKYHRIITHSLIGLGVQTVFLTVACSLFFRWGAPRRWGWLLMDNLSTESPPPQRARPREFALVAGAAGVLHWCGDAITGFGNVAPLWPWSWWDASLHLTFSFDPLLFSVTLGVYLVARWRDWTGVVFRRAAAGWGVAVLLYLQARWALIAMGHVRESFW